MASDRSLVGVLFAEAIEFLLDRLQIDGAEWQRLLGAADRAAAQAVDRAEEAMRRDLRAAVTHILQRGGTLADFRADYERIVAAYGWQSGDGKGGQKPAWHTELVFRMETANAYNAGRWAQIRRGKRMRPYIRYVTVLDNRVRFEHRQWHGIVLPVDHPFWLTHWPPNGFNCRCTVQSLNDRDLTRYGYTLENAEALARTALAAAGGRLPIDENHSTDLAAPNGLPAPARGWMVELQSRADGICATHEEPRSADPDPLLEGRLHR